MNAWGKSLDAEKKSGIRFLGDHDGSFTRALDVEFPAAPFLGTNRSKRYAITTLDGKVKSVNIEPDNLGTDGESSPLFASSRRRSWVRARDLRFLESKEKEHLLTILRTQIVSVAEKILA
jgi:2-Cys peroxiredoxin 5